jgi:hypothetical protein
MSIIVITIITAGTATGTVECVTTIGVDGIIATTGRPIGGLIIAALAIDTGGMATTVIVRS